MYKRSISEKIKMFNIVYGSQFRVVSAQTRNTMGKINSSRRLFEREKLYHPRKTVAALQRLERQVEIKILCVAVARGALNFEPLRDTST